MNFSQEDNIENKIPFIGCTNVQMYSKKIWKKGHVVYYILFVLRYFMFIFISFACIDHIQSLLVKAFS